MIEGDFNRGTQDPAAASSIAAADMQSAPTSCGDALIGESGAMQKLSAQLRRVAPTHSCVLLIGEKGTGKQLIARCLHDMSPRAREPFVVVDCAAVAPEHIATELFGEEQVGGNGSGLAHRSRPGQIALAGAGTLLLEEVTRLSPDAQARLIAALDALDAPDAKAGTASMATSREGSTSSEGPRAAVKGLQCRVLATTTTDAQQAVEEGTLRADLLYRLAVFPIRVPALRQRESDVELLAQAFLAALNATESASKRFSADSLAVLRSYSWPGNVWELRNVVHRAFILADSELELRAVTGKAVVPSSIGDDQALRIPVGTNLAEAERWMIIATLKKCGGNKTRAAALLGVSLKTLYNRLNTYRAQGQDLSEIDGELTEVAV
ncbi:MAG TPA: sigma 54-interacting transcriptional regulator [Steroidobacteraceae bacterium]|jgi:DNA-binding NtrC family response regulator